MKVRIPSPLASYTHDAREVDAFGATLLELLADLDRRYPGIRFRMIDEQDAVRPHMRIFVNGEQVWDLRSALAESDDVFIVQALSGGA
jgi:molybdopterin converting factor small subunit